MAMMQMQKEQSLQTEAIVVDKLAEAVRFELTGDSHPRQFSRLLV
jgi:hypothetical protein